jgi:salicylate hydroxylase
MFYHPKTSIYYKGLVCLLGDSAHATLPNQAAGAGQCLEDALILSGLLGLVNNEISTSTQPQDIASKLRAAFEAYDYVRRPRAQKQIETAEECGQIYNMMHPEIGQDMEKTVENLNSRFNWLWAHDLEEDVIKAEKRYREIGAKRM